MRSIEPHWMDLAKRFALCALLSAFLVAPLAQPAVAALPPPAEAVRLLGSDEHGVRIELNTPPVELAPSVSAAGSLCLQPDIAGFVQRAEPGRPQVPVKVVLLGAPAAARLSLDVTASPARPLSAGSAVCVASGDPVALATGEAVAQSGPSDVARLIDLGFIRGQRILRLELYPISAGPGGGLNVIDNIVVAVRFSPGDAAGQGYEPASAEPPAFEVALQRSLINYESAKAWRAQAVAAPDSAWTPPQPGYKIEVREEGLYQLTPAALASAGLPVDQLDPRSFRMFNSGKEVAVRVTGEADGKFDVADAVLFFGQPANTRYSGENVYWLTYGGAQGQRMGNRTANAAGPVATSFLTSVRKEDNLAYLSILPNLPGYDHWYGQEIKVAGFGKTNSVNISVATPQLALGSGTATLEAVLGAITSGRHRARLYVNPAAHPVAVWEGTWDGSALAQISATFPQAHLNGVGNNTVKIEMVNDPDRAAEVARIDWVRLGYQRLYVADNDQLLFGGDAPGAHRYQVDGFTAQDIELYDVTDPGVPALLMPGSGASTLYLPAVLRSARAASVAASVESPAAFALSFGDNQTSPRRYLALTAARRLAPVSITADQPSNLQAVGQGADYIIITHADFASAIDPLADLRAGQGKRVAVIDVQDVYDEFGGGLMSAEAIRDFVAYAYANWAKPAPSSILLVGDGTYDFRGYRSSVPTYLPPYPRHGRSRRG